VTLSSRLAAAERALGARESASTGPLVLVVAVDADGRGRFTAEGGAYEVGCREELDACLAAHGWQPARVIFRMPDLDRSPGAQARFCELPRDRQ
jgi:hypothetical protein